VARDVVDDAEAERLVQRPALRGGVEVDDPAGRPLQGVLGEPPAEAPAAVAGGDNEQADDRQARLVPGDGDRRGQPAAGIVDAEHAPGGQREPPLDVLARPAPIGRQVQAVPEVRRVERPHRAQVLITWHRMSVGRGGIARHQRFVLKRFQASRAVAMAARPSASRSGGS
jgi:hypothetical protein